MSATDYRWHYDYARLAFDTGFSFETYRSRSLDKIIGLANLDQIIKDRDVASIEKYIPAVVEFSLDNDQTSILDPTFVKIFRICQLSVQYLLFCKRYLDNSVVLIKDEYQKSNEENKNFKRQIDEFNQETSNYKKQIKELKGALNFQVVTNSNTGVFQCQECPKAFSTEEYLLAHIKRRHESLGIVVAPSLSSFQTETDKLQLEIKELKERLNSTEKFVSHNELMTIKEYSSKANTEQNSTFVTELQGKFERLKTHVDSELRILQTQKFEKEKYEKWFETFLANKLNIVNSTNGKPTTATTGSQGEIITNNCGTQTEPLSAVCENCQSGDSQKSTLQLLSEHGYQKETRRAEELTQKVHLETQDRLQKFEELLEKKVTGSIEKLENQMQTFLVKINDIEEQRAKKLNTSEESIAEPNPKPPKHRKQRVQIKHTNALPLLPICKSNEQFSNTNVSPVSNMSKKPNATKYLTNTETIKKIVSSSSESEEESESDESETDDDTPQVVVKNPVIKISTTSTLGRRSLTSLKEVAFTPPVLAQLQNEIEKVVENRLQEVGVNPKSKRLPVRQYQRALGIVSHQVGIVQKNVSNYMQIRRHILKDVGKQVTDHPKITNSKLKTFINNFKSRLQTEHSTQNTLHKKQNPPVVQFRSTLKPQVLRSRNASVLKPPVLLPRNVSTPITNVVVDISESDVDSLPSNKLNTTAIVNKPTGSLENLANTLLDTTDSESIQNPIMVNASVVKPLHFANQADPIIDPEAQTKGVLKNYPVVSSIPKKKVIFDLESPGSKENIKPAIQGRIAEGGSTTSIASSVLDGSKSSVGETQLAPNKKKLETYDSSDWELSEVSTN